MDTFLFIVGCLLLLGILWPWPSTRSELAKTRKQLHRLEEKVDLLLEHSGLDYDPAAGAIDGVMDALRQGKKIEAIRVYRESTDASLSEAKEYIESIEARL